MLRLAQFARKEVFQSLWSKLNKASLIGMNYWASNIATSGEIEALRIVKSILSYKDSYIIFDVGANIGTFSKQCLEIFEYQCRIYAFEPSKKTYESYCNCLSASIGTGVVSPINCGVGDMSGSMSLYSSEENSTIASVYKLDRPIRPFFDFLTEEVKIVTIDDFCLEHGVDHIDFLKIDIEGHELAALNGASHMISKGSVSAIQFEFGENNVSSRTFMSDFNKILEEKYDIYRIIPSGLVKWTYEGGVSEIFATMNYLAVKKYS